MRSPCKRTFVKTVEVLQRLGSHCLPAQLGDALNSKATDTEGAVFASGIDNLLDRAFQRTAVVCTGRPGLWFFLLVGVEIQRLQRAASCRQYDTEVSRLRQLLSQQAAMNYFAASNKALVNIQRTGGGMKGTPVSKGLLKIKGGKQFFHSDTFSPRAHFIKISTAQKPTKRNARLFF